MNTTGKIISLSDLALKIKELKAQNKKIVATNGAFDLLHVSHKRALEGSKSLGDVLIVGLNSDVSIRMSKSSGRPIIPELQRAELVAALECVDLVTIFNEKDPVQFLETVHPHIYTKGGDYTKEQNLAVDWVRNNVGDVVIVPGGSEQSTTKIIEKIVTTHS